MTSQTSIPVPAIRGRLPEGPSAKRIPGHLRSRMASESNSLVTEENSLPLASADSSIALAISVGIRKLLWTVLMFGCPQLMRVTHHTTTGYVGFQGHGARNRS